MKEIHVEWLNSLKKNYLGDLPEFQTPSEAGFGKGKNSVSISIEHSKQTDNPHLWSAGEQNRWELFTSTRVTVGFADTLSDRATKQYRHVLLQNICW